MYDKFPTGTTAPPLAESTPDLELEIFERFIGNTAPQRFQWLDKVVHALVRGGRLPPPPNCNIQLLMTTLKLNERLAAVLQTHLVQIASRERPQIAERLMEQEALHPLYAIAGVAQFVPAEVAQRHLGRFSRFAEALGDAALEGGRADLFKLAIGYQPHQRRLIVERVVKEVHQRPDKLATALRFGLPPHEVLKSFHAPAVMLPLETLFEGLVDVAWMNLDVRPGILGALEAYRDGVARGRHEGFAGIDKVVEAVRALR